MNEPREWWLAKGASQMFSDEPISDSVHVIEKSAYDSLLESLVLAKKQRDEFNVKLNTAVEALNYAEHLVKTSHVPLQAANETISALEAKLAAIRELIK